MAVAGITFQLSAFNMSAVVPLAGTESASFSMVIPPAAKMIPAGVAISGSDPREPERKLGHDVHTHADTDCEPEPTDILH